MPSQSPRKAQPGLPLPEVRRARPLLGTIVDISVAGTDRHSEADLHAALNEAFDRIERIHSLMSFHDPASDVTRLNRVAWKEPVPVSDQTLHVLSAALSFAQRSDGAFDPCVASELQAHGLLPQRVEQASLDASATWRDVELLSDGRVSFLRPLAIDLGGIAKGYAVDVAIEALQSKGLASALVNAGGDLRVLGDHPRSVALRDPADPAKFRQVLSLHEAALATSAAYFSRGVINGTAMSALIDGCRRSAYIGGGSVSVIAPVCMWADALTKVALFASPERCQVLLAECQAEVLRLDC